MFTTPGPLDFVAIARDDARESGSASRVFARLVAQNRGGPRFSFLDGPITANNPMGVHHARGRTYKDVFQRYRAMCGFDQRFQNGFDCQGLWVEVEVEKALGLRRQARHRGDGPRARSRARAASACSTSPRSRPSSPPAGPVDGLAAVVLHDVRRATSSTSGTSSRRVRTSAAGSTRGHRVMPWCARCGTSISQHEMLESPTPRSRTRPCRWRFPLAGRDGRIAARVDHHAVDAAGQRRARRAPGRSPTRRVQVGRPALLRRRGGRAPRASRLHRRARARRGADLVGLALRGPFDDLPAQRGVEHRVIAWDEVAAERGHRDRPHRAGLRPGGLRARPRAHGLAVIAPVDEEGRYLAGFGPLEGTSALARRRAVVAALRASAACSCARPRTGTGIPRAGAAAQELIFRLVDEWFIRADEVRPLALAANAERDVATRSTCGLRMNDWLANMGDWCISRKRYWGLPLPFYPCGACGRLTVVGSRAELRALAVDPAAVDALPELHRPWIDDVAHPVPGLRPARARGSPRSATAGSTPASSRSRRCGTSRIASVGALVPGRSRGGGGGADPRAGSTRCCSCPWRSRAARRTARWWRTSGCSARTGARCTRAGATRSGSTTRSTDGARRRSATCSRRTPSPSRSASATARPRGQAPVPDALERATALFVTYANLDRPALPAGRTPRPRGATALEAWILARLQATRAGGPGGARRLPAPPRRRGVEDVHPGGPVELVRAAAPAASSGRAR